MTFNDFFISNATKTTKDLRRNTSQLRVDEDNDFGPTHSQFNLNLITKDLF